MAQMQEDLSDSRLAVAVQGSCEKAASVRTAPREGEVIKTVLEVHLLMGVRRLQE